MSDLERLHRIKYMIQARKCVPIQDFLDELEISKATFIRNYKTDFLLFLRVTPRPPR